MSYQGRSTQIYKVQCTELFIVVKDFTFLTLYYPAWHSGRVILWGGGMEAPVMTVLPSIMMGGTNATWIRD
jgi:hypothetical protein